jgi:hypothetical protein
VHVSSASSERLKDALLALFIVAVVVASGWIIIKITIGEAEAARLFAKVFSGSSKLTDETVTVPTDEFRGVLVKVPYAGKLTLEIASQGGKSVDVHLIDGSDLLRLANKKPPFAALKLGHHPGFESKAVESSMLSDHLVSGTYVVVLEHSTRGTPASDVRVLARLEP